jgi:hypothetical protein
LGSKRWYRYRAARDWGSLLKCEADVPDSTGEARFD